jgi:hypothetical protein
VIDTPEVRGLKESFREQEYLGWCKQCIAEYLDEKGVEFSTTDAMPNFDLNHDEVKIFRYDGRDKHLIRYYLPSVPRRLYEEVIEPGLTHLCNTLRASLVVKDIYDAGRLLRVTLKVKTRLDWVRNMPESSYRKLFPMPEEARLVQKGP